MASIPRTVRYTFPSTGYVSLATITGWDELTWMFSLSIRSARTSVNDIAWKFSGDSDGGYIGPGEAISFEWDGGALIRKFNLYGTAGDVAYLTIGLNSEQFDYDA